jgi:hypothetical protein
VEIEELVEKLGDPRMKSMYQRLVEGHRAYMPSQSTVVRADYQAFYGRLIRLANDQCVRANEAFIQLKAALGMDAVKGIWGPSGWKPPGA